MKTSLFKKLALIFVLAGALMLIIIIMGGCTKEPEKPKALKFAVSAFDTEVFDPILHGDKGEYAQLVYPYIVGTDLHAATWDKRTGLAYKWEANPENTVWTFYLRKDAKWWDGTPITAKDIKFSLPRNWSDKSLIGSSDEITSMFGGKKANEEVDRRIEIIDDYTIRFHLSVPSFLFADQLSGAGKFGRVAPKHWVDKYGEKALIKGEMGGGPYKIVDHVAGSLIRFAGWKEHPYQQPVYDEIYFMQVPEEASRLAMLKTGEIDIASFSAERLPELTKAKFSIVKKPTGIMWDVYFQEAYKDPVLAKLEVRRAIMMAIDKVSFNNAFFYGSGEYINDGGVAQIADPRGVVTRNVIPYDLEAAKKIIAREVPSGYTLQVIGTPRGEVKTEHIEAIVAMLAKAGFKVNLQLMDYTILRGKWKVGGLGPSVYIKDGAKNLLYYPGYSLSPEKGGNHEVINLDPVKKTVISKVTVNPKIPWEDLVTLQASDDLGTQLQSANSWDEYWSVYSKITDRAVDQIAPGSGFLFTSRIFAARPGVLPKWEINLGLSNAINIRELAIYPPEYEAKKYQIEQYEGKR